MKKNLLVLLFILFGLFLVGCGSEPAAPIEESYKVTINYDGNVTFQTVKKGEAFNLENIDDGYLFIGFYSDCDYQNEWTDTTITSNITIYAKTVMKGEQYKITYNLNGGQFTSSHANKYTVGETYTLTEPVKEPLYSFIGWKYNGEYITEISDTMYGDIVLDANWNDDASYYNITYSLGEGTLKDTPLAVLRSSDTYVLPEPSPTSSECFYGWYLEPTFETRVKQIDATVITKDTTLYAAYGPRNAEHTYISFLGDSISTFKNYIPSGYAVYYPRHDVLTVSDTWWYQLTDKLGYNLLMNNSYSGSKVGGSDPSACINASRIANLAKDGRVPNIVVIFMGTNDWAAATTATLANDKKVFKANYITMINNIYDLCGEDVTIYPCILPWNNYGGGYITLREGFNEMIIEVAEEFKLTTIDFTKAITQDNVNDCTPVTESQPKNCHPNAKGMKLLAECAYEVIYKTETAKFEEKEKNN